jgi:hypothetical protein
MPKNHYNDSKFREFSMNFPLPEECLFVMLSVLYDNRDMACNISSYPSTGAGSVQTENLPPT